MPNAPPVPAIAPLLGGGAMGQRVRDTDWRATPLGDYAAWPPSLRAALSMVLNTKGIAALYWGPEQWLLYNDAYASALGDRHPHAFGRPMPEVLPDLAPVLGPQVAEVLRTGAGFAIENLALTMVRNGQPEETVWTYSFSPVQGETAAFAGVLLLATEMTQHTASRRAGQRVLARLERHVVERTQERDLIWQVSLDMLLVSDLDGVFLDVNPAWTRVLGWSRDELLGRTSAWLEHPDDQARTRGEIARLAAGDHTFAFENRFRTRAGDYRTLSWTAVAEHGKLFCVARDTTAEHRQTEALLAQTAELQRYRDIVEASEAPICAFDTDLRLIAFNRAHSDEFYRIFGYRVRLGDVFPDLFSPDQAPIMRGFMLRALSGEVYTVVEEFGDPALIKPYWEVTYYPLRDADGRIVGAFHYAKDISARLRAEAELNAMQDALRQSQKMEAIGQLTGGVAHDFNNLLTVIKSGSDLLKRPNLSEEQQKRYVTMISGTVDRAARLTGQLLAFARRQTLKPEVFSVSESVRGLADMMRTLCGARIHIVAELPAAPCFVNADASQFDTALVNLAVNARDAMVGEGRITIAVRAVDDPAPVAGGGAIGGPSVAVALSDTGSGIPADMLQRIFEPFFTTKETGKGTGLGLSQVIGFAKQSGGDVGVDSVMGSGTTFTLYLPRVAQPARAAPEAPVETLVEGHGTRVLVVEDNVEVGTFAVQSLSDLGYLTMLAVDGTAALAELARDGAGFDLVFSDVMMPGMTGIQLGQEIHRLYPDLPVVLTSGYSHGLAQNGTHGFALLQKPYSIEQLSRILAKAATRPRPARPGAAT